MVHVRLKSANSDFGITKNQRGLAAHKLSLCIYIPPSLIKPLNSEASSVSLGKRGLRLMSKFWLRHSGYFGEWFLPVSLPYLPDAIPLPQLHHMNQIILTSIWPKSGSSNVHIPLAKSVQCVMNLDLFIFCPAAFCLIPQPSHLFLLYHCIYLMCGFLIHLFSR